MARIHIDKISNLPKQGHFLALVNETRHHAGDYDEPSWNEHYVDVIAFSNKEELEAWVLTATKPFQIVHATPLDVSIKATVHISTGTSTCL